MPPKRGGKASPAAAAKPASASGAASASSAASGSATAELLKECDKLLKGVRTGVNKSAKVIADLLAKQPCSLTYRTQSAAHLIYAVVEPASTLKHLDAACAVSLKGVTAVPSCLHMEVMNAVTHHRRAFTLTAALLKEPVGDSDSTERARLEAESCAACDAMRTLSAKLDNADFSAASLDVLEQEKRIALQVPDSCTALEYRRELKGFVERLRQATSMCSLHCTLFKSALAQKEASLSANFREFREQYATWTRLLLVNEVDPLKKTVPQTQKDARLRAAALESSETLSEPAAAAALPAMSTRGSASAQRAPAPTPKSGSSKRGAARGRSAAAKGLAATQHGAAVSTISKDALPLIDGVIRLFRDRAQAGGHDAVLKLLQIPVAELEAFADEHMPVAMHPVLRDALTGLESSGSTIAWRFCGITANSYEHLWAELHNANCPRPSELPLWTDAALFVGDETLSAFVAPLIAGAALSESGDEGAWSTQMQQRASSAWQQLWVGDDVDLDSAGKPHVGASASGRSPNWSRLSSYRDEWQGPASRVLDTRLQLLSGPTARHRKLEALASSNRLDDATTLVLSPPPTFAMQAKGGRCLLEIRSARGAISERDLDGYDSFSDDDAPDEDAIENNFCFPVHERVVDFSRAGSTLPPFTVLYTQAFVGGERRPVYRVEEKGARQRWGFLTELEDCEATPSPEAHFARYPTFAVVWPTQTGAQKLSEVQLRLATQIKFLSTNFLYNSPFQCAILDKLTGERMTLLRDIAVADVLRGLRLLCESRLLPVRCVRELKRHLLRCGVAAFDTQPLQASLRQLETIDLVAAARYVHQRYLRRFWYMQETLERRDTELIRIHESSLVYVQSSDAAPAVSVSAACFANFVTAGSLDCEALSRFIFEDTALDAELEAEQSRSADESSELLRAASNKLKSLLDLSRALVDRTRAVLSAKPEYDALDRKTISGTDPELRSAAAVVLKFRVAVLQLSRCVMDTHYETLAVQVDGSPRDRSRHFKKLIDAAKELEEHFRTVEQNLRSCCFPLDDANEITTAALLEHVEKQLDALEEEIDGDLALAHAQAAKEMLDYELGVAHENLYSLLERCCEQGFHYLDPVVLAPFKGALRKRLREEADVFASSMLDMLIADEESRKTSEEAAKQKNAAKRNKQKEAEKRKREEAAAAAAAAAAQRAAEEREAEDAARAAEAALAAERKEHERRAEAERTAALELRAQQMAAAKKQEEAEKARQRELQRQAERDAQLAQEEADHARAIAESAAEFAQASAPLQPYQPPHEYHPSVSSGAASILPPIAAFAGLDLLSLAGDAPPAAPAALPTSIFDWPQPQSLFSVLPPSSILPPLPGSAILPPSAAFQPLVGGDVSGLSNAAGEYNCFLNSLVQALNRLRCFKHHLLVCSVPGCSPPHRDISRDIAVVRALKNLFLALESGARLLRDPLAGGGGVESVAPTDLRVALAALAPGGGEAGVNEMADAAEVLTALYDCFLRVSSAFRHASEVSPVQQMFGLEMSEQVYCDACRLTTHKLKYNTFFHLVHATALRHAAAQCPAGAPLEQLLAFLLAEESKSCDTDFRGCGRQTPISHALGRIPEVFTISLGWDSSTASEAEVGATLRALSPTIFPQLVYRGTPPSLEREMFELRAMVLYYGSHYVSIVRSGETWTRIDDASITRVGGWDAVCDACARGHLQPTVLFYERAAA